MGVILSTITEFFDKVVVSITLENNENLFSNSNDFDTKEQEITDDELLNIYNETVMFNSSNTELFIKTAKFIHDNGLKEEDLLKFITEPFTEDVLAKLQPNSFKQLYLNKNCSVENLIKSLKEEPCFGIFKYYCNTEKLCYFVIDSSMITSNFEYLKYAHENGFFCDERTTACAAKNGRLDCLKYLHENGCPWDERTCQYSARYGYLDCLKYAHENGCSWDKFTCTCAAENGHLDCLKYLKENNCQWDVNTFFKAFENGHLECLIYMSENGSKLNKICITYCAQAALNGQLECLKYLHEKGCQWNEMTCQYAATKGHLNCLKYAHENGCTWDKNICKYAAENGHLECLKYAHENGCSLDNISYYDVAFNRHSDCLKYLHETKKKYLELHN